MKFNTIFFTILLLLYIPLIFCHPISEELFINKTNTCVITKKYIFNIARQKTIKLKDDFNFSYTNRYVSARHSRNGNYHAHLILNNEKNNIQIFNETSCVSKNKNECDIVMDKQLKEIKDFLHSDMSEYKTYSDANDISAKVLLGLWTMFVVYMSIVLLSNKK